MCTALITPRPGVSTCSGNGTETTGSWFELYKGPGRTEKGISRALVPALHSLVVNDVILDSGWRPAGEPALACAGQKRCVFVGIPYVSHTVLVQET